MVQAQVVIVGHPMRMLAGRVDRACQSHPSHLAPLRLPCWMAMPSIHWSGAPQSRRMRRAGPLPKPSNLCGSQSQANRYLKRVRLPAAPSRCVTFALVALPRQWWPPFVSTIAVSLSFGRTTHPHPPPRSLIEPSSLALLHKDSPCATATNRADIPRATCCR